MNILIFSWRGPGHPNAGGAEISTHEHAMGWIKAGHNVVLFTSYYKGAKRQEKIDGVEIIRSGRQFFGVHWEAFKWYCFASHQRFDLVIDQFHGIPFFTPLYVKEKKLSFIHEVTKEVWKFNQFPPPVKLFVGILGNLIEPFIFKLYKNIPFMTVSYSTKRDLEEWGIPEGNITVVNNGVAPPPFKSLPKKETKTTIIFLGALAQDKGIEDALRVFAKLNSKFNGWQFWVVGKSDSKYLSGLKALSNKWKLGGKIKFWGYVSEQKKFELLARAHLLINPSIREGWGLVVIEAASAGTPTIAFNVAGLRDSIIDAKTGILTEDNTIDKMVEEIVQLMHNKPRYEEIRKNAILWSKKFTWKKTTKMSLKLIDKIMKS